MTTSLFTLPPQVLLTCDLTELKPVMQMTFGDWELFRTLVTILREKNAVVTSSGELSSIDSLQENMPPPRNFLPMPEAPQNSVAAPKAQYSLGGLPSADYYDPPRNMSHATYANQSIVEERLKSVRTELAPRLPEAEVDDDAEIAQLSDARGMPTSGSRGSLESGSGALVTGRPPLGRMKRNDSMVVDVINETNYLHRLMDAALVGEDLSEEESDCEDTYIDMEVRALV